jgi:phage shock protein C
MFCANCGKQILPGTNFCPACGTRVGDAAAFSADAGRGQDTSSSGSTTGGGDGRSRWTGVPSPPPQRLERPRSPRILGGVCAAFALHFGWNLDAVRIVAAVLGLFYGVGVLAYIACWILIPEAQYALPQQSR